VNPKARVERGACAHVERQREDPLAHRYARDNAIDDVRRGVGHPTSRAARAEATRLAREGDEDIVPTVVATRAGEPVVEDAAAEIRAELVANVLWKRRVVCRARRQ